MLSEIGKMAFGLASASGGAGIATVGVVTLDLPVLIGGVLAAVPGIWWAIRATWTLQEERTKVLTEQRELRKDIENVGGKVDALTSEHVELRDRVGRLEGRHAE